MGFKGFKCYFVLWQPDLNEEDTPPCLIIYIN
jgi:hypothetical protein